MAVDDPYRILGVPRWASTDAIEKAYRREARRVHPDVNPSPDAAREFYSVQHAYELLRDPDRRRDWDRRSAAADLNWRRSTGAGRIEPLPRRKAPAPGSAWITALQSGLIAGNIAALAFWVVQIVLVVQIRGELLPEPAPRTPPPQVAPGVDVVWDLSSQFTPPPVSLEEREPEPPPPRHLPWLRTGLSGESDGVPMR